jgi:hypothetical protein
MTDEDRIFGFDNYEITHTAKSHRAFLCDHNITTGIKREDTSAEGVFMFILFKVTG